MYSFPNVLELSRIHSKVKVYVDGEASCLQYPSDGLETMFYRKNKLPVKFLFITLPREIRPKLAYNNNIHLWQQTELFPSSVTNYKMLGRKAKRLAHYT